MADERFSPQICEVKLSARARRSLGITCRPIWCTSAIWNRERNPAALLLRRGLLRLPAIRVPGKLGTGKVRSTVQLSLVSKSVRSCALSSRFIHGLCWPMTATPAPMRARLLYFYPSLLKVGLPPLEATARCGWPPCSDLGEHLLAREVGDAAIPRVDAEDTAESTLMRSLTCIQRFPLTRTLRRRGLGTDSEFPGSERWIRHPGLLLPSSD
jgi:hypothetical protein